MEKVLVGKRVLVVDDMSVVRKSIAGILRKRGLEVLEAEDGEEALVMVSDHDLDAFLLDIQLTGMDGIALCARLRSMERFRYTPIIFITGLEQDEVLQAAFAAGGDDVISKPVSPTVLCARLGNYLRRLADERQIEYMRRSFNRYVCPRTQAMVELYAQTGQVQPPHESRVCVLFTDVRGFTQTSQQAEPQVLFNTLSEQLGAQASTVYRFGGYIDKFSGDGLMAVFDDEHMALNACLCALKIIEYARGEVEASGGALHQLGVGVHMGPAMIGNIGSNTQLDYTAIGPTVNLAARLCGYAEALSVVVSEAVYNAVAVDQRFEFSGSRQLNIKGIASPVSAYNLLSGRKQALPPTFLEGDAVPE